LKSIISRIANSVFCNGLDSETCRNETRRAESEGGVLGRGSEPPPNQLGDLESAVSTFDIVANRNAPAVCC